MKTTIDLPEPLVRKLKIRAARDGVKFKELATEILRAGLAAHSPPSREPLVIKKHPKTGLPVIQGRKNGKAAKPLSPEQLDDILLAQEIEWARVSA